MVEKAASSVFGSALGQVFRRRRKFLSLSLAQASAISGLSVSLISKIETGASRGAGYAALLSLSFALGSRLHELVASAEGVELGGVNRLSEREQLLIAQFRAASPAMQETIELVSSSAQ